MPEPDNRIDIMAMDIHLSLYWLGNISVLLALGLFAGVVIAYVLNYRRKKRYSPFTEDAFKLPGHSLRVRHNDLSDDLLLYFLAYTLSAFGMGLALAFLRPVTREIAVIIAVGVMLILLLRVWRLLGVIRAVRLGREGEEYVGQELNLLMCRDAHVFHDIIYSYGNIDHIVVGRDKVFTVETKAVSKPQAANKKNGKDSKVVFDGQQLIFPHMTTSEPIKQAKQHADYVRRILKERCGVNITVVPVVALPGWFVDAKSAGTDVLVINPRRGRALDKWLGTSSCKVTQNKVAVYFASVARSITSNSELTDPGASAKYDIWLNPRYKETSLG